MNLSKSKTFSIHRFSLFLFMLFTAFAGLVLIYECFHPAIIGDETFSMQLIKHSYREIIHYTASDVHPPLYYFILKFVTETAALFSISPVSAGKIASALPYFLLLFISATKIRSFFGNSASVFFSSCIMGMAHTQEFSVQIRMYSWGMFFVLLSYLCSYRLIKNTRSKKNITLFILFSLMAAYTHYFACIAVISVYLSLFIWFLFTERKLLTNWLIWTILTCIGYLPWLTVVFNQVRSIKEHYWIEEISSDTFLSYFQFLFNPSIYRFHSGTLCGLLLLLLIIVIVIFSYYTIRKNLHLLDMKEWFFALSGIFVPFFEIGVGILASLLIRPVFSQRYIFVSIGALWLGFSILFSKIVHQCNVLCAIALYSFLLFILLTNITGFIKREEIFRSNWNSMKEKMEAEMAPNDVILTNFGQVRLSFGYCYPQHTVCYYWRQQTEDLFQELYLNLKDTRDPETILTYLNEKNAIFFVDAVDLPEFHFLQDCTTSDLNVKDLGQFSIEEIPVHIYKITLQ